jgi:hypothetical protein
MLPVICSESGIDHDFASVLAIERVIHIRQTCGVPLSRWELSNQLYSAAFNQGLVAGCREHLSVCRRHYSIRFSSFLTKCFSGRERVKSFVIFHRQDVMIIRIALKIATILLRITARDKHILESTKMRLQRTNWVLRFRVPRWQYPRRWPLAPKRSMRFTRSVLELRVTSQRGLDVHSNVLAKLAWSPVPPWLLSLVLCCPSRFEDSLYQNCRW